MTVLRVLTDNGGCYRSFLWRDTCAELDITPKRTRPYRPQTNGKIERFHRTLVEGWAFKKYCNSESARLAALPATHNRSVDPMYVSRKHSLYRMLAGGLRSMP